MRKILLSAALVITAGALFGADQSTPTQEQLDIMREYHLSVPPVLYDKDGNIKHQKLPAGEAITEVPPLVLGTFTIPAPVLATFSLPSVPGGAEIIEEAPAKLPEIDIDGIRAEEAKAILEELPKALAQINRILHEDDVLDALERELKAIQAQSKPAPVSTQPTQEQLALMDAYGLTVPPICTHTAGVTQPASQPVKASLTQEQAELMRQYKLTVPPKLLGKNETGARSAAPVPVQEECKTCRDRAMVPVPTLEQVGRRR